MQFDIKELYKRYEGKPEIKFACSNESCTDSFCRNEEHGINYIQHPIGIHLIHLHIYSRTIQQLRLKLKGIERNMKNARSHLQKNKDLLKPCPVHDQPSSSKSNQPACVCSNKNKQLSNSSKRKQFKNWKLNKGLELFLNTPVPNIPSYPQSCLSQDSLEHSESRKMVIQSKASLRKVEVNTELHYFVESVVAQLGFDSYKEGTIDILSKITGAFLKKLTLRIRREKEDEDFIDVIDKVLLDNGYGGIREVWEFYNLQVKVHKEILKHCIEQHESYEKMRQEAKDAYDAIVIDGENMADLQNQPMD